MIHVHCTVRFINEFFCLPSDTLLYPAHDYKGYTSSTVAEEKEHNPRLNTNITESQFVSMMNEMQFDDIASGEEIVAANLFCGMPPSIQETTCAEVSSVFDSYRIIDVREPDEFTGELGHIEKAELVPLGQLQNAAKDWDVNEKLLMVCRSGKRSADACRMLTEMNFTDVTNLVGGMIAWNKTEK